MTSTPQERLVRWLEQAYATEKEAETLLHAQVQRLQNYHVLAQRIQQHLADTRRQADMLEQCLRRQDATAPRLKGAMASALASIHAAGSALASDEVIKDAVMTYALVHMKAQVYESLALSASYAGDFETRTACEAAMQRERRMGEWLREHFESTVLTFLQREQGDGAAKR